MTLTPVEFEVSAHQVELINVPELQQGQSASVLLDAGILSPEAGAVNWFTVQADAVPAACVRVGRARYAFSGPIVQAELLNQDGIETAAVVVQCGDIALRALCAPGDDGRLPYGTWETRTLTGLASLQGIFEDDFELAVGAFLGVTFWGFERLVLGPGDPKFGEWYATDSVPLTPLGSDRLIVQARIHRPVL